MKFYKYQEAFVICIYCLASLCKKLHKMVPVNTHTHTYVNVEISLKEFIGIFQ